MVVDSGLLDSLQHGTCLHANHSSLRKLDAADLGRELSGTGSRVLSLSLPPVVVHFGEGEGEWRVVGYAKSSDQLAGGGYRLRRGLGLAAAASGVSGSSVGADASLFSPPHFLV